MQVALETVTETDACLIWPGRMTWVDAETVTTLIETHGARRASILRPRYAEVAGWPALLPIEVLGRLAEVAADLMPDDIIEALLATGVPLELIDTGNPGVAHDISVALDQLPDFQGPPEPVARPPPNGARRPPISPTMHRWRDRRWRPCPPASPNRQARPPARLPTTALRTDWT